jgi:hypothetical protein
MDRPFPAYKGEEHKPVIAVYLSRTDLPDGLRLTLSDKQAILRSIDAF